MNNQELKHYGVLGMKWGISRSKEVRGVKKAYKYQKRKLQDDSINNFDNAISRHNQVLRERRSAIKDAKRKGGDVKAVRRAYDKKLDQIEADYDRKEASINRQLKANKTVFKKDRASAREQAANRLFKDGDAARNKRIANLSLGKALTQTFLMGSYGAKKYNQYRAAGESRGKSGVKGLGWNIANNIGYQLPTTVSNAQFVKNYVNDRRKNKRK